MLRKAVSADIPAIVELINRAFAVEKFFKSGERIAAAIVSADAVRNGPPLAVRTMLSG